MAIPTKTIQAVLAESMVSFETSQGIELQGTLLKVSRFHAVFEIYTPASVLQMSEVLQAFKILVQGALLYSGKAVVTNLVNVGTRLICEANLGEGGFPLAPGSNRNKTGWLSAGLEAFLEEWHKVYRVRPEFKVVMADMQSFLTDLRLWLEQVELEIRSAADGNRLEMERAAAQELSAAVVPAFDAMHERLESISQGIEPELRPVHQAFAKRQLHPVVMCSPFAYRTYHKPLGYAGDYEMVNMIARQPYEGSSLFAKVVNSWFLSQWPARAHRNRIQYLKSLLAAEALRGAARGRPMRVLNLGCGPAWEIQGFLAESALADFAQFTLLDFNEETLQHVRAVMEQLKRQYGRRTSFQFQRKSVLHVLKEGAKPLASSAEREFDLIYCAGLFDYLPDRTCKQLMSIFYERLAPGGLLAVTNVDDYKPFRHMLEFVLDWNLIYRDARKSVSLFADRIPPETYSIRKDSTGVNVFLEARKESDGR